MLPQIFSFLKYLTKKIEYSLSKTIMESVKTGDSNPQ